LFGPGLLHVEGEGIGQVVLEELGRLLRRVEEIETILLRDGEIHPEAFDLIHEPPAGERRRLQEVIKEIIDTYRDGQHSEHRPGRHRDEEADADGLSREKGEGEEGHADSLSKARGSERASQEETSPKREHVVR
jgi:hypothetical protein